MWWQGTDRIRQERMRTAQLARSAATGESHGWDESSNRALGGSIPRHNACAELSVDRIPMGVNGGRGRTAFARSECEQRSWPGAARRVNPMDGTNHRTAL